MIHFIAVTDRARLSNVASMIRKDLGPAKCAEDRFVRDMLLKPSTEYLVARWIGKGKAYQLYPGMTEPLWAEKNYGDLLANHKHGQVTVMASTQDCGILLAALSHAAQYARAHNDMALNWICLDLISAFGLALSDDNQIPSGLVEISTDCIDQASKILGKVASYIDEGYWTRSNERNIWQIDRRMAKAMRRDADLALQILTYGAPDGDPSPNFPTAA
ncbi:hypothetical protein AB0B54_35535 [Microbispora bryophytorum]|uniref:hypothetical protein n=1 Tax=Microbispora bryophytorum TaxID=1460882 RepID=UPI0033E625E0